MKDKDVMDKLDAFFEAFQEAGMSLAEGQTAIVCNDGVVMVTSDTDGVNVVFCNRKIGFDYDLRITDADVEYFNDVMALREED